MFHVKHGYKGTRVGDNRAYSGPLKVGNTHPTALRAGLYPRRYFRALLPDAEIAEDHVENILDVDPPGETAKGSGGGPQLLRHQILLAGQAGR
jgi:hypothetical protein